MGEGKSEMVEPAKQVRQVLVLLIKEYGAVQEQPTHDPVSVLVQTILSQNTSDRNSGGAFQSLAARFRGWEEVAEADVEAIAYHIRGGGLGRIKAQRIKQALEHIVRERGRLELDFLSQLSVSDAEDWLLQLPGVGLKTARCVLLFALGMPALPVDTHIVRVTRRLGLIGAQASLDEAHRILGKLVPPDDVYQFHVLVIGHGRKVCRARNPDCLSCVLKEVCDRVLPVGLDLTVKQFKR